MDARPSDENSCLSLSLSFSLLLSQSTYRVCSEPQKCAVLESGEAGESGCRLREMESSYRGAEKCGNRDASIRHPSSLRFTLRIDVCGNGCSYIPDRDKRHADIERVDASMTRAK